MIPVVFVIKDAEGVSFAVDGSTGWTTFIAGYVKFPEPRQQVDGWPVLEPRAPQTIESLRSLLRHAILESV